MMITSVKKSLIEPIRLARKQGLKRAWRESRWKLVFAILLYYLVRDTLLYIVLPFLVMHF